MSSSQPLRTAAGVIGLARWALAAAALLGAVVLPPNPTQAVIEPIYTLPFYGVGPMVCGFHCYYDETYGWHEGVDFELGVAGVGGESVAAAAGGTAKNDCGLSFTAGYFIVLNHGNGHRTRYLHLNSPPLPANGSYVSRGQVIGYEGNTGYTIPAGFNHLHLETRHDAQGAATCGFDGTPVDPYAPSTYMWEDSPPNHADFAPAVASWLSSRVDVFVRTKNNGLRQKTWNGSTWTGWLNPLPSDCLKSAPAASTWSNTRIDVFYRGCNDVLYWAKWTGSSWTPSTGFSGSCLLGAPAATSWGSGRIDVLYRGCSNNLLYWTYTTNGGASWSGHVSVPYATCLRSGPGAVSGGPGWVHVVYRGCDDAIWHHLYNGGAWQQPESFAGCTMLAPSITSWAAQKLDVFHRGCGPAGGGEGIYQKSYNDGSWSYGWTSRGGCLASGPGTDAWSPDQLNVMYRGCDSPANVYKAYWNGGSWTHAFFSSWP